MPKKSKINKESVSAIMDIFSRYSGNDMFTLLRTNGKSKIIEDFNILEEYNIRFKENPSIIRIIDDNMEIFNYRKLSLF